MIYDFKIRNPHLWIGEEKCEVYFCCQPINAFKMNLIFHIQKFNSAVLFCIFFLFGCPGIHAQDKSAVDTIAYIIKNQKNHTQLCDDLYILGNYYWNIGKIDNAQLAVSRCKELAEKDRKSTRLNSSHRL